MTEESEINGPGAGMAAAPPRNWSRSIAAFVGWAVPFCVAVSLLSPLGMMAASALLMAFGLWCFISGMWRWQKADWPSATMNASFAIYAVGSAAISWHHGDPLAHFEQYLPFLGAGLLAIGLRVADMPPYRVGAAFAAAAILAAAGSTAQVLGAAETHRANFYGHSTTFGAVGAFYAIICASMATWAAGKSRPRQILLAAGALGGVAVALLSGSKGSWLALAIAGPLALALALRAKPPAKTVPLLALVAALIAAAVFAPHSPVMPRVREAIERRGDPERIGFWEEAAGLARQHPFLGSGRQQMIDRLAAVQLRLKGVPLQVPHNNAHNEYLDALATRGAAGLALVLAAIAVPALVFLRLWRRGPVPLAAASGLFFLLAFAIVNNADVQFMVNPKRMTFLFAVLFFATCASPCARPAPRE